MLRPVVLQGRALIVVRVRWCCASFGCSRTAPQGTRFASAEPVRRLGGAQPAFTCLAGAQHQVNSMACTVCDGAGCAQVDIAQDLTARRLFRDQDVQTLPQVQVDGKVRSVAAVVCAQTVGKRTR